LAEGPVGPVRVVMLDVLGKGCFKVAAAEDEHPVEALAPDGADDALADGVGPGCPNGALDDPGALCGEDSVEGGGELGVAIADEELDGVRLLGELDRNVAGLLGHPTSDRVRRDAGDPHETRVVVDGHEDVEPAEEDLVGWKRLHAISPLAWVARNSVQVGPDLRGDGSMPWRFRIAQTLEAAMTMPMVASSPWMRR